MHLSKKKKKKRLLLTPHKLPTVILFLCSSSQQSFSKILAPHLPLLSMWVTTLANLTCSCLHSLSVNFSAANKIEQVPLLGESFLFGSPDPTPLSVPLASQVTFVGFTPTALSPQCHGALVSVLSPLLFLPSPRAHIWKSLPCRTVMLPDLSLKLRAHISNRLFDISKVRDNLHLRFFTYQKQKSWVHPPHTYKPIFLQLGNEHHGPCCLSKEPRRHSWPLPVLHYHKAIPSIVFSKSTPNPSTCLSFQHRLPVQTTIPSHFYSGNGRLLGLFASALSFPGGPHSIVVKKEALELACLIHILALPLPDGELGRWLKRPASITRCLHSTIPVLTSRGC